MEEMATKTESHIRGDGDRPMRKMRRHVRNVIRSSAQASPDTHTRRATVCGFALPEMPYRDRAFRTRPDVYDLDGIGALKRIADQLFLEMCVDNYHLEAYELLDKIEQESSKRTA